MPWTAAEATSHTKSANTAKKKRQWAHVANSMLESTGSEAKAIKAANSAVGDEFWDGDTFKILSFRQYCIDVGWTEESRAAAAAAKRKAQWLAKMQAQIFGSKPMTGARKKILEAEWHNYTWKRPSPESMARKYGR
jgi:hypothetical protein